MNEIINVERLNSVPAKQILQDFTSSFPPPKVLFKYANLPRTEIWDHLNRRDIVQLGTISE